MSDKVDVIEMWHVGPDGKPREHTVRVKCDCCGEFVDPNKWDGIYGVCAECATCASLEHFPCCHGTCPVPT